MLQILMSLIIAKNGGGTVLPLILGGVRGGKRKIESYKCITFTHPNPPYKTGRECILLCRNCFFKCNVQLCIIKFSQK
jgi:hypothetical protein